MAQLSATGPPRGPPPGGGTGVRWWLRKMNRMRSAICATCRLPPSQFPFVRETITTFVCRDFRQWLALREE